MKTSLPLIALLLAAAACESNVPTQVISEPGGDGTLAPLEGPVSGSLVSSLSLRFVPPISVVGGRYEVLLVAVDSSGVEVEPVGTVTWASSDPSIATVDSLPGSEGRSALVTPVGVGAATIIAMSDGLSATGETRIILGAPGSDALAIDSFSVIEFSYPPSSGTTQPWYYAPQIVMRDQDSLGAEVVGVQLSIPGIGANWYCWSTRTVTPNASIQLFREIYGDFELTFDKPGVRAADRSATAVVYFIDSRGHGGSVAATGSIAPGALPTTYTGGRLENPWRCGYPFPPF